MNMTGRITKSEFIAFLRNHPKRDDIFLSSGCIHVTARQLSDDIEKNTEFGQQQWQIFEEGQDFIEEKRKAEADPRTVEVLWKFWTTHGMTLNSPDFHDMLNLVEALKKNPKSILISGTDTSDNCFFALVSGDVDSDQAIRKALVLINIKVEDFRRDL